MAGSTHQGKRPLFSLLMGFIGFMGFIGLQVTSALGQDTVYIGGTGGSVEINLDVLDQLGASQTVPQMLQTDIRRSQRAAGIPLPLTGETPAVVTLGLRRRRPPGQSIPRAAAPSRQDRPPFRLHGCSNSQQCRLLRLLPRSPSQRLSQNRSTLLRKPVRM